VGRRILSSLVSFALSLSVLTAVSITNQSFLPAVTYLILLFTLGLLLAKFFCANRSSISFSIAAILDLRWRLLR